MPRNRCRRRLGSQPPTTLFTPAIEGGYTQEEVFLTIEEFESIKLKDFMGMSQIEAAARMDISQPTFHRQLSSARKKIADAIVNGKSIRII